MANPIKPHTVPQSFTDLQTQLDAETNAIATYQDSLRALISTSMSAADVATVLAGLTATSARLNVLGSDPANPIPPAPPLPAVKAKP